MATIYDVAKLAGVSPKTVSRVLNGDAPVNAKTRTKVLEAIETLGYFPSQAARMMRSNRSGLIGLITGAITRSPETAEGTGLPDLFIVQAIQRVIAAQGKILMIADTGGLYDTIPTLARTFMQHRVEGLIYVADYHREIEQDLPELTCPFVLVNCFDRHGTEAILPDDRACQEVLVRALLESGHRRIGFLTLSPDMPATALRNRGYADAHRALGLAPDPDLVVGGMARGRDLASDELTAGLDRLLSLAEPPTVICCGNDEMAMRIYGLLRSRGLRVPEDISVAGFDNYRAIAETLFPPLTTVELPYRQMGEAAAATLLRMIGGDAPAPAGPILVPGPLAWRSSVTALTHVSP
ncbi:MAG: LacI family DNA-binding transcriptional regulator [Rhodobacteraceae bacterium]|nr:MAG: LacI family DNA-binding transcriptional regulator [Paracoccaceae bacterium]